MTMARLKVIMNPNKNRITLQIRFSHHECWNTTNDEYKAAFAGDTLIAN
jgi:hypothetical protein